MAGSLQFADHTERVRIRSGDKIGFGAYGIVRSAFRLLWSSGYAVEPRVLDHLRIVFEWKDPAGIFARWEHARLPMAPTSLRTRNSSGGLEIHFRNFHAGEAPCSSAVNPREEPRDFSS